MNTVLMKVLTPVKAGVERFVTLSSVTLFKIWIPVPVPDPDPVFAGTTIHK
jgi:hypothetical protein